MKRMVIDCTEEMAALIHKLTVTGDIIVQGEGVLPTPNPGPEKSIRDFFGFIPEAERESWHEYSKTLGRYED